MSALHSEAKIRCSIEAFWEGCREWVRRGSASQLQNCGAEAIERMAHDAGLTADELRELVRRGPHSADLLLCRMATLGLNPDEVARVEPLVFHDLQRVCSMCDCHKRCERDLERNPANPAWKHYCMNANTLMELNALPWAGAG